MSYNRTWRVWLNTYAPVLFWIGFIFAMSTDYGSSAHTSPIIRPILAFLFPSASSDTLDLYQWYVRKLAHLTEYGILGMLTTRLFQEKLKVILAVLVVLVVACLDELHQSYVGSRTASPYDVLLDTAGGAIGAAIVWFIWRRRERALE